MPGVSVIFSAIWYRGAVRGAAHFVIFLTVAAILSCRQSDTPDESAVTGDAPCESCRIVLEHRLTLQVDDMTRPIAGQPTNVVRGPGGQYILFHPGQVPSVFDSVGRFVRELGRIGDGPGEYRAPVHAIFLAGDSILVLDAAHRRATVVSPELIAVRSISLPLVPSAGTVLGWPDRVVIAGNSYELDHAGWPLHLLDMSGDQAVHVRSMGDTPREISSAQDGSARRRFAQSDGNSFWTAHLVEYRLARMSDEGEVLASLKRTPEWFPGTSGVHRGNPTVPPPPLLSGSTISRDTLWLAFDVPRPDWQLAWREIVIPPSGELSGGNRPEITELIRSRIEAVDVQTGELIASQEVDGVVVQLYSGPGAIVYDLDSSGLPRVRVAGLSLAEVH